MLLFCHIRAPRSLFSSPDRRLCVFFPPASVFVLEQRAVFYCGVIVFYDFVQSCKIPRTMSTRGIHTLHFVTQREANCDRAKFCYIKRGKKLTEADGIIVSLLICHESKYWIEISLWWWRWWQSHQFVLKGKLMSAPNFTRTYSWADEPFHSEPQITSLWHLRKCQTLTKPLGHTTWEPYTSAKSSI